MSLLNLEEVLEEDFVQSEFLEISIENCDYFQCDTDSFIALLDPGSFKPVLLNLTQLVVGI